MNSEERRDAFTRLCRLDDALPNASAELRDEERSIDESCLAALAHLAPFFTQSVHSGTPERTDDVANDHGTYVTERVLAIAQMWLDIEKSWPSEPGGQRDMAYRSGLKDCAEQLISEFGEKS